jgi:DNA (cytosine-5)-methyltransferase 3A
MNVLSLFDGMSCGQIALERAKIKVDNYYASEIDKHAIKVTQHNYPNTIQLGDVTQVDTSTLPKIDLLIGGSPCQGFSTSGKMLNFDDPRSKLFFEYVRILKEVNPKYFLLENVVMKKEWEDVISDYLSVEPHLFNSVLTSAQSRKRLYWTNIPNVSEPQDMNISLIDILEHKDMVNSAGIRGRKINKDDVKLTQCLEVRSKEANKSNCLTTVKKDTVLTNLPSGKHIDVYNKKLPYRHLTKIERCRLMNIPDNYLDIISDNQAVNMTGNGWEINMITHILKNIK